MSTQICRKDFEKIYKDTYNKVLRFIVIKCRNIDDINDIIQDTYLELLKLLKRKKMLEVASIESYILGISNNVLKRYYHKKKKDNIVYCYQDDSNLTKDIEDTFDLEANIINKHNIAEVWEYLKQKDLITTKVFYLYFAIGLKISEISKELGIGESNIKNRIYRTLKEIKKYLGKDVNGND